MTVDAAMRAIAHSGRGTVLAKVDIKSAYRIVEVDPEDRWLLGFQWDCALFVDTVLPFGLRFALKVFTALADAMEWIVRRTGVETIFHYIDFLLLGACAVDLIRLQQTFGWLHIPPAPEKWEGPATCVTFLGIELDSELMVPGSRNTRSWNCTASSPSGRGGSAAS